MEKEIEKIPQNGAKTPEQSSNSRTSKAYVSAMKAFTMTNKRLHPKLYKGNAKVEKIRS